MRYAAGGVTTWITAQAVINIGAVLGLLPIAGVPLPLFSYGGSALLPTMFAVGTADRLRAGGPGGESGAGHAEAAGGPREMEDDETARHEASVRRAVNFGACRTRRRGDRRPHRARARPRGRPAEAGPDRGDHCPRHGARTRDPARTRAGLRAGTDPCRTAAAQAHTRADHRPGAAARHHQGRRADPGAHQGGLRGRLRRLRRPARLPGGQALGVPIVVHEANARPGLANKIGSRYAHGRRRLHPGQQAARSPLHRHPAAPHHRHPRPGRGSARRRAPPSVSTPTCRRCWSPAARRAPAASTRWSSRSHRCSSAPESRSCTRSVRRTNCRASTTCRGCRPTSRYRTWTGWISRTPRPT